MVFLPELLPERELLADSMALTLGSSSAIVAHNLASLGSRIGFQSLIGEDPLGQIALERLAQSGVDTSQVRTSKSVGTGLSVILQRDELAQHPDLFRHHCQAQLRDLISTISPMPATFTYRPIIYKRTFAECARTVPSSESGWTHHLTGH